MPAVLPETQPVPTYQAYDGKWLYVARIVRSGLIKVGCTRALHGRLSDLRHSQKSEVELLGMLPGDFDDEARLHKQLDRSRYQNQRELYHETSEITAFLLAHTYKPEAVGFKSRSMRPFEPKPADHYRLTPEKVQKMCYEITRYAGTWADAHSQHSEEKLVKRLKAEAAAGYDIAPLLEQAQQLLGRELAC